MSIRREIVCDVCGASFKEQANGTGFPGWVIVAGIGSVPYKEGEQHREEHTTFHVCPQHAPKLAKHLTDLGG